MTVDLEELKRLAQAATPGPWKDKPYDIESIRDVQGADGLGLLSDPCVWRNEHDAHFIAAANPAAVLALIERVETLEWNYAQTARDNQHLERDVEAMEWERDQAKARVATLEALARKGLEAFHHGISGSISGDCHYGASGAASDCRGAECREWAAALEAK